MGILKKIWDMLPEGRPICVPKPEAWGVKQEDDKETDKNLKKKDEVRLIGIQLSSITKSNIVQLTFKDMEKHDRSYSME